MKKLFLSALLFSLSSFSNTGNFELSLNETLYHAGDYTKFSVEANVYCFKDRQDAINALTKAVNFTKEGIDQIFKNSGFEFDVKSYGFSINKYVVRNYGDPKENIEDPCNNTWYGSQAINLKFYVVDNETINGIMNDLNLLSKSQNSTMSDGSLQYLEIGSPSKGLNEETLESLTLEGERILREKAIARFENFMGDDYSGRYYITNIDLNNSLRNRYEVYGAEKASPLPAPIGGGSNEDNSSYVYVDLDDLEINVSVSVRISYEPKVYSNFEGNKNN